MRSEQLLHSVLALVVLPLALCACAPSLTVPPPPPTEVDNVVEMLHGVEIVDPYRWLEDQESQKTRGWIGAQNAYTDSVLGDLPVREQLEKRFTELLTVDMVSTPRVRGSRYFFSKRSAGEDLFVIYLREGHDGEDEVLLDPHPLSEDNSTSFSLLDVSEDGKLLAYGVRVGGQDEVAIRLFDVEQRADRPDVLPKGRYFGVSITPDNGGLFYTRHDEQGPRVRYHEMGTDPSTDPQIFGEGYGPEKIVFATLSDDGHHLLVHVLHGSSADKTEIYLKDLRKPGGFTTVVNDVDARFFGEFAGDTLLIQTNWEAPNGRLLAAALGAPARAAWREVVPEHDKAVIENSSAVGGRVFVNYLENINSRVASYGLDGSRMGDIEFDTIGTINGVSGRWDSDEAFFGFESFTVPDTIYRFAVASGEREEWWRVDVPIDTGRFVVKQEWFESKDGTRVPMFLVHGKGLELDGSNPTLLTGYGGFTASLSPGFSATATVWVEQGGVYGVVNLRGGGEFGEAWHRAGMLANKQNTFDDFIAAAEYVIDQGYTKPERLAIRGGSNGGLLVAAAMTQRPDLFGAVICTYPLLDMVRYHKFLVARYWVPEYGSSDDPEQFRYIYEYSPYHRVEPGTEYPAVLFITGDGDTRVAPLHARKMAALVQAAKGGDRPALLRYHVKAGHSGGRPISQTIDDLAESYSFALWQLGVG